MLDAFCLSECREHPELVQIVSHRLNFHITYGDIEHHDCAIEQYPDARQDLRNKSRSEGDPYPMSAAELNSAPELDLDPFSLVRNAFEEVLRYASPVQAVFRTTTRDIEIAGTRIPEGMKVLLFVAAANRDPRCWQDPDRS